MLIVSNSNAGVWLFTSQQQHIFPPSRLTLVSLTFVFLLDTVVDDLGPVKHCTEVILKLRIVQEKDI